MAESYGGLPKIRCLEVADGVFSNISGETKFGHALAVGNTLVTVWSLTTLYTYPSDTTAMTISSGDVNDDAGDTGARTAKVTGLDADWAEVEQTVTLDGQNGVSIPTSLRRVYRIEVLTAGSNGSNEGILYVGSGAIASGIPANKFAVVEVGINQTLMTPYTVPIGKKGYITAIYASLGGAKDLDLFLVVRKPGEVFRVRRNDHVRSTVATILLDLPIKDIPAKSDVELRAKVDAASVDISASYDILLIDV